MPVILLTALTADDKKLKGIDVGADAYIEKPFHTNILIATCCQLLEQRNHLKQVYGQQPAASAKAMAPEVIKDEQDKKFQAVLDAWLAEHITDPQLNIDSFAESMGYGRTTFYKKIKRITGTTPNDYMRTLRMNKAAELLKDDRLTVAEVDIRWVWIILIISARCLKTSLELVLPSIEPENNHVVYVYYKKETTKKKASCSAKATSFFFINSPAIYSSENQSLRFSIPACPS